MTRTPNEETRAAQAEAQRAAQIRVLLQHDDLLARQVAELTVGMHNIQRQLSAGDTRMSSMSAELVANTATTTEVRDLLAALKGGMKVLEWLGKAARWAGGIALAVSAIYTVIYMATHGGNMPGGGK